MELYLVNLSRVVFQAYPGCRERKRAWSYRRRRQRGPGGLLGEALAALGKPYATGDEDGGAAGGAGATGGSPNGQCVEP